MYLVFSGLVRVQGFKSGLGRFVELRKSGITLPVTCLL